MPRTRDLYDSQDRRSINWQALCGAAILSSTVFTRRIEIRSEDLCAALWDKSVEALHVQLRFSSSCN